MKKIRRRIVAFFMCVSMLGFVFPAGGKSDSNTLFAAEKEFVIEDGVLKKYNGTKLIVNVPDGVTEIGESAFKGDGLCVERVILPDSVEIIDDYAFYNCNKNLSSVEMSPNIYYLGKGAFGNCYNLQEIDLSNTRIEVIQEGTFEDCRVLSNVMLPDTVKIIGDWAFRWCKKLRRVDLKEGVEHIGEDAFCGCQGLNSIDLPTTLSSIGYAAFSGCNSLISVKIPAGVTEIPKFCFRGDSCLQSIYLPDTLEVINRGAIKTAIEYGSIGSIKSIFIPESVRVMYEDSLDCGSKYQKSPIEEYIAFPDSTAAQTFEKLKNKGDCFQNANFVSAQYDAKINFDACGGRIDKTTKNGVVGQMFGELPVPSLKGWTFKGWYTNDRFEQEITCVSIINKSEYTLYAKWEKAADEEITYKGEADDFVIRAGKLEKYTGKQSVVIVPDGVTDIGSAFKDKTFISEIVLPDSVVKMGRLSGCSALRKINIPDGVTEIVNSSFSGCTALEEIVVGKNVTKIGSSAFSHCISLEKVVLPDNLVDMSGGSIFNECHALKSINLPESLETIGKHSFEECLSLVEIDIPGKVKTLSACMFWDCYMLESVRLGDGIQTIETRVFDKCHRLKSIYIPESVESVTYKAFQYIPGNSNTMDFEIKGFRGSSAFDVYEAIASCCQNINVTFKEVNYDSTIQFDSESCGQTIEPKKAVIGQLFGTLPEVEKQGYIFGGWSDGSKIIKSTSKVESENITLIATWIKEGEIVPGDEPDDEPKDEPEATPIVLPPSGTEQLEYVDISTAEELNAIRNNMSGNYRLVADIDLSLVSNNSEITDEFGFTPLGISKDGSATEGFTGTFDGNGHSITGLSIEGQVPYKNTGLFARIEGGTVKNLNIVDCKIVVGNKTVVTGALAGYVGENKETLKKAVIDNINVSGVVTFSAMRDVPAQNISIGGIFGYIGKATVSNCHNKANVAYYSNEEERPENACSRFIGGVTGYVQGGNLSCSSNLGSVLSYRKYFGLFADKDSGDWMESVLSGRSVYDASGGICGVGAEDGHISQCYNLGAVYTYMHNTHELFTLNISSHMDTMSGGIVGALYRGTKVSDCYNTGKMYSKSTVDTTIMDEEQYFSPDKMNKYLALLDSVTVTAPQNATAYAGGIVGFSHRNASGPIERCINTGVVEGSSNASFPISNGNVPTFYCRYLKTDDAKKGCGGYDDKLQYCVGLDSEELKEEYSYRTFDLVNTWLYAEGMEYPQLYNNMQSKVSNVTYISTDMENLSVAYGKDIDLSGFKVSFNIEGLENPVIISVGNSRECGYDRYKIGQQHLCLDYFGVKKEFDIVVQSKHIHEYEMIFTWEDDYKGCTAKWVCKDNDSEKTVDCKVKETIEEAGYGKEGSITYTATAVIDGKEYTDTKVIPLEKLPQFDLSKAVLKMDKSFKYSGNEITPEVLVYDDNGARLNSDWYEVSYSNNVNVGKGKVIVKAKEGDCPYSGQIEGEFTITKVKEILNASVDNSETKVGDSEKLNVYNSNENMELTYTSENPLVAEVNAKGEITAIAPGNTTIIVSGTCGDNNELQSCEIPIKVLPAKPTISLINNKANGICINWKKDDMVTGYKIYKSKDNGTYKLAKTITNNKTTTWTDTGAKTNGAYYLYKIVTYYNSSEETLESEESSSKMIFRLNSPSVKAVSKKKGKCLVSWKLNKKATAYQVKYQIGKKVKTVKISSKKTSSKTIGSLKKGKIYKVSVRAMMKKGNSVVYSSWSPAKSIKIKK